MAKSKISNRSKSTLAQKERQDTEQVNKAQSLALVKNLVRVSISTVCHLRNIFPNSCFKRRAYAGLHIYQLDASSRDASTNETVIHNEEAYMLTKWLECGVIGAIELKYLRRVEFIIACPELKQPLESYSFEMDYPENEDHNMTFNGTKITTLDNIKGHVIQLIRSLMQFSDTLSEVPSERIINMKLWYFDERTPADWEPKYFRAADPSELSFKRDGDHDILRIRIGEIQTPHHAVKVRFEGIDTTLLDDDGEIKQTPDDQGITSGAGSMEKENSVDSDKSSKDPSNSRRSGPSNLLTCKVGATHDDDEMEDEDEQRLESPSDVARDESGMVSGMMSNLQVSSKGRSDTTADGGKFSLKIDAARRWVTAQTKPTKAGLAKHLQINRELARDLMQKLVDQGFLIQDSNNRYHKVNQPLPIPMDEVAGKVGDRNGDTDNGNKSDWSTSQASHDSDDSETQDPNDAILTQRDKRDVRFAMPPPSAPGNRARGNEKYTTPTPPALSTQRDMQPAPEKPQQAKVLCMGTKRILDDTELSNDGGMQGSDPTGMFDIQTATGTNGSVSTLGYEVSLSQSSTVSSRGVKKCSLVADPIRQSTRSKRLRSSMNNGSPGRK